jgi:hypothetical protein
VGLEFVYLLFQVFVLLFKASNFLFHLFLAFFNRLQFEVVFSPLLPYCFQGINLDVLVCYFIRKTLQDNVKFLALARQLVGEGGNCMATGIFDRCYFICDPFDGDGRLLL